MGRESRFGSIMVGASLAMEDSGIRDPDLATKET